MKQKTRDALRSLLADIKKHEAEDGGPDVTVDLADLKKLLRWAQNSDHVWFKHDRVELTGVRVPFDWLDMGMQGTVAEDSPEDGTALVRWDDDPEKDRNIKMFHNEIKLAKP